jgi:hypothetical protein
LEGTGENRTVTIKPALNQSGNTQITISVNDGEFSTSDSFTLIVNAVNDSPEISDITDKSTNEDITISGIPFTISDIETPSSILILTKSSSNPVLVPENNIILGGSGENRIVTITPADNQSGTTVITIYVNDGDKSASDSFTLTVNAVNDAPTISNITNKSTDEDTDTPAIPFTINDLETSPSNLTLTKSSSNTALIPINKIVFSGSGGNRTVTITPADDKSGSAEITINVSDGEKTTSDSFILTVNAVNDPPVISDISDQSTDEDITLSEVPFTISDIETPASILILTQSSSDTSLVPKNKIVFGGTGENRTVTITPAENKFGTATITINVSDGDKSASDSFTLTVDAVNDPPTISNISNTTIPEDQPSPPILFTIWDEETSPSSLTLSKLSSNTTLVPLTNIVFGGSGENRNVTITPAHDKSGSTEITINVSDGDKTTSENFTVIVTSDNDPPEISDIPNQSTSEDTPTPLIPFTITDVETEASNLTLSKSSSNTTLVPLYNIVFGGSDESRNVTITPAENQSGLTEIIITVDDGQFAASDTLILTVNPVNDPPTISDIPNQTTNEDIGITEIPFTISDVETDASVLILTKSSSNTTLIPENEIVLGGSGQNRTISITPVLNQSGSTNITIYVSDGELTVSDSFDLTVNSVNDPPTISDITDQIIDEDNATSAISFFISDVETQASNLILSRESSNTLLVPVDNIVFDGSDGNRTVTITPADDQNGLTEITITVSDGENTVSNSFNLTVNAVNDPPTISNIADQNTDEDVDTPAIPFSIFDKETSASTLILTKSSSNPSLIPESNIVIEGSGENRTVTITPAANQSGSAEITITVDDGEDDVFDVFNLIVNPVNDKPVITSPSEIVAVEHIPFSYTATATDPENNTITFSFTEFPSWMTPSANQISGTPPESPQNTSFIIIASDGALFDTLEVGVAMQSVNDSPVITSSATAAATEHSQFSYTATASDPENNPVTFYFENYPGWMTPATNQISGIPPESAQDTSFLVIASDGNLSDSLVITVTVTPVNDPPIITSSSEVTAIEHDLFSYTATATDPEGGSINIHFENYPIWMTPSGQQISGIPPESVQDTSFNIIATDGQLNDTLKVEIIIDSVDDPPVITSPDSASAVEHIYFSYTATATDPEGDAINFLFKNYPSWMASSISKISGTPPESASDTSFKIIASANALSDTQSVSVTISPVNDPPEITSPAIAIATEDILFQYTILTVDPEGDSVSCYFEDYPDWLSTNNNKIEGTPSEGTQDTSFIAIASDGLLNDTIKVIIQCNSVNDPPEITSQDTVGAIENVLFIYSASATDIDGPYITIFFNNYPSWLTTSGSKISGIPPNNSQDTTFIVIAWDGESYDSLTVTLLIKAVNDPPFFDRAFPKPSFINSDILRLELFLDDYASDPDDPDSVLSWSYLLLDTQKVFITIDKNTHVSTIIGENITNNFKVEYTVTDPYNASASDTLLIKIENTGIGPVTIAEAPQTFILYNNFPNPFNPFTTIRYGIPRRCKVNLSIFNMLGQEITVLIYEKEHTPGTYQINWDASSFPSGIYFYRLHTGDWHKIMRMILIR